MDALSVIKDHGIIPVLGLKDPETAPQVAAALRAGGLPLLEVTMRAPLAMDCLKPIKAADPDMLVGAGTILHTEQVDQAKAAGADFIVAPGFNPAVVKRCQELGLPVVPGCITPTEIEAGLALGLTTFKFFPSEAMNGMATIKQLCGPYGNIQFIPTAGITMDNLGNYLSSDKIAAVGGRGGTSLGKGIAVDGGPAAGAAADGGALLPGGGAVRGPDRRRRPPSPWAAWRRQDREREASRRCWAAAWAVCCSSPSWRFCWAIPARGSSPAGTAG